MRSLGGIPVDRSQHNNLVDASVQAFVSAAAANAQLVLAIAPEGTWKAVISWKAGFWHIARAANVPICCGMLDYGRKEVRLGPVVVAEGSDAAADVTRIQALFSDATGLRSSKRTE